QRGEARRGLAQRGQGALAGTGGDGGRIGTGGRRGGGDVHGPIVARAPPGAGQLKKPAGSELPGGPAPSPTSGCVGIVKEPLAALHAALQKRPDGRHFAASSPKMLNREQSRDVIGNRETRTGPPAGRAGTARKPASGPFRPPF